jgi:type IV pilus assembly protein PilN
MMQFNLLPYRQHQRSRRRQYFYGMLLLSMLLGCALSGIGWRAIVVQQQTQQMRNRWLQQSTARLNAEIKHAAALQSQTDALLADIGKIESWQRQRDRTARMLATLATHIPADAYLQKIRQQGPEITIAGLAASNRAATELLQNLNAQTANIASAQLLETRADSRPDGRSIGFSIALTLRQHQ